MATEYRYEKPRMFTAAGYRTQAVGKMHFDSHDHGYQSVLLEEAWRAVTPEGFKCDYRQWFEANHPDKDVDKTGLTYTDHRGGRAYPYDDSAHPTYWTALQAVEFLDGYEGDKPWFLKVSFQRPHPPFDPPKRLMEHYHSLELPKAEVGDWAERMYGSFEGSVEDTPTAPRGKYPPSEIHSARAAYYASIAFVDEQIGRLLHSLERRGELEHTLILFTSDHGDMMGDHHLWRKSYAYEGSARVPMIVRWPESIPSMEGVRRGTESDHLVELRDVLPTFLDAAGLDRPAHMEGRSMLDVARGATDDWREVLDLEHGQCYWDENAWVALTDGRQKYIYFTTTGEQQLFDLQNDPHELHDLATDSDNRKRLEEWRNRMIEHLSIRGEPWIIEGDLAIQRESVKYGPNHPGNA
jgi:arylsulfatase A-like enzyme